MMLLLCSESSYEYLRSIAFSFLTFSIAKQVNKYVKDGGTTCVFSSAHPVS